MGSPLYEKRVVPSGITPLPWVARTETHRLVLPLLQNRHSPHSAVYSGMTWSPGLTLVTPSPTSTTMPAPSWPSTAGEMASGASPDSRMGERRVGGESRDPGAAHQLKNK